jgi:hypothetical protein
MGYSLEIILKRPYFYIDFKGNGPGRLNFWANSNHHYLLILKMMIDL